MQNVINGFIFNSIGDLIHEPENTCLELLKATYAALIERKQYICASRIQHRINVIEMV
ncbi:hypothetical protein ACPV5U_19605 [Vibrio mediterranei]